MGGGLESAYQHRLRKKMNMTKEERVKKNEYNKIKQKEYREKDREEYNLRQREYKRDIGKISKELGVCNLCGEDLDNLKFVRCSKCREHHTKYYRKRNGTR